MKYKIRFFFTFVNFSKKKRREKTLRSTLPNVIVQGRGLIIGRGSKFFSIFLTWGVAFTLNSYTNKLKSRRFFAKIIGWHRNSNTGSTTWKVSKYGVFSGPYSVRIWENTEQKKLRIWKLFMQWSCQTLVMKNLEYQVHMVFKFSLN